jgi:hypothetical protein
MTCHLSFDGVILRTFLNVITNHDIGKGLPLLILRTKNLFLLRSLHHRTLNYICFPFSSILGHFEISFWKKCFLLSVSLHQLVVLKRNILPLHLSFVFIFNHLHRRLVGAHRTATYWQGVTLIFRGMKLNLMAWLFKLKLELRRIVTG